METYEIMTATGTAKSGYIQRKIVKVCEDIQVRYDGSVRDSTNKIYQFSYNEDGVDPTKVINIGNNQEPFDISRMVNRLNLQHELKQKN